MRAPVPTSSVDRKTSAEHEPRRFPWARSPLFWLVVLASAGVVTVTALSARALGTHTGRHAYPHVLAETDGGNHALAGATGTSGTLALLPLHDIERHFSALVGFAGVLGVPVAVPLMAIGVAALAVAVHFFQRPRPQAPIEPREISLTSRRRRARRG